MTVDPIYCLPIDIFHNLYVLNDTDRSNEIAFDHSANNAAFTDVASYQSDAASTGSSYTWLELQLDLTINNLSIAPDDFYYFRWSGDDFSGSGGARDQFAIDNITISAEVIPEPKTYALIFGALALTLVMVRRRFKNKDI